jgi:hypothetical protein
MLTLNGCNLLSLQLNKKDYMTIKRLFQAFIALLFVPISLFAQVTTGSITGTVKDLSGGSLQGATVEVVHEPSGTKYKSVSNVTGKFTLPGLRIGGPYKVTISYVGFKSESVADLYVQLGDPIVLEVGLSDNKGELKEVVLSTTKKGALISKDRKGTSTNISNRLISSLPTISRNITDLTKLTPQSNGTSFAGQDNRAINFTLDGSIFNNSFGLTALNGGQTSSSPISLDAIQEIQINVSPYNLRDAGFTGASINAVTKSGTNNIHGTMFYNFRNQSLVGKKAGAGGKEDVVVNDFDVKQFGISLGGPIIKNKLFYFANYEGERRNDPGTTLIAKNAGNVAGGSVTSVKEDDLISLSSFLQSKFNYSTGAYQNFKLNTNSDKAVARLDWNISDKHKMSVRGNLLRSHRGVPVSNSNAINGNRNSTVSMAYENTSYEINNDIYGVIAQLNSRFSSNVSNELTFGYTANRDYRDIKGSPFPTVDIQDPSSGRTYISFGVDPFTPNNKLNTDTWQFSDNLTVYKGKHTVSMGLSYESFNYLNGFTPRINGIYTFGSLNDFYTAANAYIANPTATTSPVPLKGYSATWSNTASGGAWYATTKARSLGVYVQDDYELNKNFSITYGVRFDVPFFAKEGTKNAEVDNMSFIDEKGVSTKLSTSKLPGYKVMINPRVGFNYDVNGDKSVQIRGGMGLFTGRPPFVFVSNQMGNNGVLNGDVNYTGSFGNGTTTGPTSTQIPFNPNVPVKPIIGYGYPASVPGQPATTYNIATTEEQFKFPQIFRTNLAVDYKIFSDVVASAELVFTQSLSNIYYYNANLTPSASNFVGIDNRPRFGAVATGTLNASNAFPTSNTDPNRIITPSVSNIRLNSKISDATVMKSGSYGGSFMGTMKIEKPLKSKGFGWLAAYNFGYTRDFINAGSIAASSWTGNKSVNGNNRPDIAFSDYDVRNRLIANLNYRTEVSKHVAVQFSLFYEGRNWGRFSYAYSGDMNGDGVSGNDLMFVPTADQISTMKFENYSLAGVTQTQAMQQTAFENFISQDKYLSSRRGDYAQRNGVLMPTVNRFDISAVVELFDNIGKDRHTIQLRADIFNVGNLIDHNAGVAYVINTVNPIAFRAIDNTTGLPVFRMNAVNNSLNYSTYRKGTSVADVWQAQLGIRYIF